MAHRCYPACSPSSLGCSRAKPAWRWEHDQLRVLICDGPTLLAWVGTYRPEPFSSTETAVLQELVPILSRRLALERELGSFQWLAAAMTAALEALETEAFIMDGRGAILHANRLGEQAWNRRRQQICEDLRAAIEHDRGPFRITRLVGRGVSDLVLAVSRGPQSSSGRDRPMPDPTLTLPPSLERVAALLAEGLSDKEIAERTGHPLTTIRT